MIGGLSWVPIKTRPFIHSGIQRKSNGVNELPDPNRLRRLGEQALDFKDVVQDFFGANLVGSCWVANDHAECL